ncbi:ABC transporter ATP-binding protein [Clostridium cibarium]|uniref:ABC transporter ATP-binding protein n=1 Tax=Clostridium cibarium TaxID=2762247 RepID=UPI00311AB970
MKRFKYKVIGDNVFIDIKNQRFIPKKKMFFVPYAKVNINIKMDLEEFEKLNSGLKVLLFKGEDEVEEDSKKETDLLVGNNLYKLYGNNKEESAALKGVTLRVHEGDFICIMGPSGSGKSTLINLLSTIDEPTRGTIKFNGKNILSMGEREIAKFRYENLGFIFQNFNLIDNLTIKENISIPMLLASNSMEEIEYKVNRIVEKLDIRDLLNKYPYECSGGENQRVACARALVTSPKIIVADEPTGNLDTKNSHELLTMLQRLNREGTTILMVTHDNMIASYSQKLLFIRDGRVDKILKREDLSQKEYFHKIIDITSKESQNLIDIL